MESVLLTTSPRGISTRLAPAALLMEGDGTRLNYSRVELVMVREHALGRVIQEFERIFPVSREAFQYASLQHIPWTIPLQDVFPHAASNFFHHVALRLEFRSGHDRARRGYDPGVLIAQFQNRVHRIH